MLFGLFKRDLTKPLRAEARELLRMAQRIYDYRHDLWDELDRQAWVMQSQDLEKLCNDPSATPTVLRGRIDQLKEGMVRRGGNIYPVRSWVENAEMMLVAAILAIGVRTFFVQPFKIPTNSMFPTYAGMLPQIYTASDASPTLQAQVWRWFTKGASFYAIKAPQPGECLIPLFSPNQKAPGIVYFQKVRGFKWICVPTHYREYTLYVGGEPVSLRVPYEFPLEQVIEQSLLPPGVTLRSLLSEHSTIIGMHGHLCLKVPGRIFKQGEGLLRFDLLTGDMLFVDRFSYHFCGPKVGDPVVFRTKHIQGMDDKYYIKRLVGLAGDRLKIEAPTLFRNGQPIEGARAFSDNQSRVGLYGGYYEKGYLDHGQEYVVPAKQFFCLGDNSANSFDGRYWGTVPQKDVIGRAIFILHPFTKRWGIAH